MVSCSHCQTGIEVFQYRVSESGKEQYNAVYSWHHHYHQAGRSEAGISDEVAKSAESESFLHFHSLFTQPSVSQECCTFCAERIQILAHVVPSDL